ncbi:hypothetical protein JZO70_18000 [Enterococcus sp. 669A]|uniref:HTH cro/C1-type domain-containing protein n=1 Tax=Candidatus Enterococcus moelleringii TaxID=2815325 RepID=A0ABS3LI72_9ENTE|nr:hypothetical protein [Enterococcus sp. 669A]MBO1308074.1 hypothetical protein [Enterococcus sp. 669A]
MEEIIERYSSETGVKEQYKKLRMKEIVEVKQEQFEVEHEYYQRLSDGELFEPFENPDKNLEKDYALYRQKHSLLSPEEVKQIRMNYQLSVRDFSKLLGISYSNLSTVENGSIQANYIDSLLRLAEEPLAFLHLVQQRSDLLSEKAYQDLSARLEQLVADSKKADVAL